MFALLSNPERIRAVLAQPQDADVDAAYGVVTAVSDRSRRGATERTTRQLFPSVPAPDPALSDHSRNVTQTTSIVWRSRGTPSRNRETGARP